MEGRFDKFETHICSKQTNRISLGYQNFSVSTRVSQPLRCCHFQGYNQVAEKCRSNMGCLRSGGQHKVSEYSLNEHSDLKFPNCKEATVLPMVIAHS